MATKGRQSEHQKKPLRVLIIEDEFVVSMTFKLQLEALGCHVVGTARTANTGIELAHELKPEVVLMDIGLPDRDGVEATREIMEHTPTKVIVVTAYGDHRVQQALDAGARLVLMKPILEEQLAQAIDAVTGGKPADVHRDEPEEQ